MLTTHHPRRSCSQLAVMFVVAVSAAVMSAGTVVDTLNIYSARQEALIKPLLDRFSNETGVEVNLVTGSGDALITRLTREGRNSPADVLLTSDAGRLYRARQAGVLQPVSSDALTAAVPENLRSPDNLWYGLSVRARVLIIAPERVNTDELQDYEDLADPQWKGRICVRSSGNIYNQSLVAGMLAQKDRAQTQAWLDGFVRNFARPPQGGDRDQIKAVAAGQCDVAVVNSYYYGAMLQSDDAAEREAAGAVAVFFPNQDDRGTHINISGAGVTAAAGNKQTAIALIEYLARPEAQSWYAERNNEYPVRKDVAPGALLESWGDFKADSLNVTEFGRLNAQAVMAMDRANWK